MLTKKLQHGKSQYVAMGRSMRVLSVNVKGKGHHVTHRAGIEVE
jgi:hypothetical protein